MAGLDKGECTAENIERIKAWVPPNLAKYVEGMKDELIKVFVYFIPPTLQPMEVVNQVIRCTIRRMMITTTLHTTN